MPTVSICIPTYNRKDYLQETLASVFEQTYEDFEVVVVDDGSTDDTGRMIDEAGYDLRYHWQENQGEATARNKLVELAYGRFVAFIDSDDLLMPDAIERMVKAMEAEDEDIITYGSYIRIDEVGNVTGQSKRRSPSGHITAELFEDIIIHPNGSMYPRRVLQELGGFDTSLNVCTDYDLHLRASIKYRYIAMEEPTFKHRRHSSNVSSFSFANRKTELNVLENFYYNRGGKEVIPRRLAMKRLSQEGYRAGRCAIEEGDCKTGRFMLRQSLQRYPRLKPLLWLIASYLKRKS